jgi:nucleoside-diphosphate-sugar epimerase
VVDGVLRACAADGASGEVFNVATGGRISLKTLFQTVRTLVSATVEPIYAPARAGDVRDSQADITKAVRVLGYRPLMTFDEGLARTIEWHRASATPVG